MAKYKIVLAYDGTNYGGWQVQLNTISIQTKVQEVLSTVFKEPISVTGSSRTDAGVHALGQVAHFETSSTLSIRKSIYSCNGLLPQDIRVRSLELVDQTFHARYSSTSKIYHYHLHLDPISNPFSYRYSYHVHHKVDLNLLKQAASLFIGTKDFTSFANKSDTGAASRDPIRTLFRLDVVDEPGGIRLEFEADGFLYKMVRNITGTLLEVSSHKIQLEMLPSLFSLKDRKLAGGCAPARGLFLMQVNY